MRKKLEKNEFLSGLEVLFKKYGYTKVYSSNDASFDGTKMPGIFLKIVAPYNAEARREIAHYVDYTIGMDDFTMEQAGHATISNQLLGVQEECVIYEGGEFYAYIRETGED